MNINIINTVPLNNDSFDYSLTLLRFTSDAIASDSKNSLLEFYSKTRKVVFDCNSRSFLETSPSPLPDWAVETDTSLSMTTTDLIGAAVLRNILSTIPDQTVYLFKSPLPVCSILSLKSRKDIHFLTVESMGEYSFVIDVVAIATSKNRNFQFPQEAIKCGKEYLSRFERNSYNPYKTALCHRRGNKFSILKSNL